MPDKLLVLWDADCGFCSSVIAWFALQDRHRRLNDCPIDRAPRALLAGHGAAMREAIHVVTPAGQVHRGAAAVAEMLLAVDHRWIGSLLRTPGIRLIAEIGYRIVARNRARISAWLSKGKPVTCGIRPGR